ncbi:lycopene cyclase family protein [Nocardiopsis changdeensis]|uniref:Lycopene cyclase n=1 Tax=Nocardiopsis changdeensis TaxID=2831969 RepID=A0ABX8BT92_9ACTN|nr:MULTISPECIES: lycopene cyclase family protein [Nocardiopsis]QUX24036.1 lycopene cyclase [Nocardiopsis changdeensis]QYX34432.1 lycopene cyclase [Nocardiopsis sp. MT53]
MNDHDVVIVGGGAAGLTLAHRLSGVNHPDGAPVRVALAEPPRGPHTPPPRTWCFWEPDGGEWDGLLAARWRNLTVVGPDGDARTAPADPFVYKMLRSVDLEARVRSGLGDRVAEVPLLVDAVRDGADRAVVEGVMPDGSPARLTARWVFDSRPPRPLPTGRTLLLQHFRGWFVRTPADAFDPEAAVLMDFTPPQPENAVAFAYVLPLSAREALVEYTEFGPAPLTAAEYDRRLADHCARMGLAGFEVTAAEQGVIPMTDAPFRTRAGRRVFRIGGAGGATRPSTGYTFSGVLRQTAAVAAALERGVVPVPPIPHRRRHLAMDAVLLRALATGRVRGADFFTRLLAPDRLGDVLAFLDGGTRLSRELALGLRTPVVPMSLTVLDQLGHAVRTALSPGRAPAPPPAGSSDGRPRTAR